VLCACPSPVALPRGSSPPRSYGQRLELSEGTSPRGLPCYCTDKAGNIYSVPLCICRVDLLMQGQRRGTPGNGLSTTIKYLRLKTSGAAGNGLGAAIKYLRRTTSGDAGSGLGDTIKYLRRTTSGDAGTWVLRPITCGVQRAVPRATAWAPRSSTCAAPRASAWAPQSSTCDAKQVPPRVRPGYYYQLSTRRYEHRPGYHGVVPATRNELRCWQRPGHHDQVPALARRATAWAPQSSNCEAQRAALRATAWSTRSNTCGAQRAAPRA
jgi:hypothetical protein